MIAKIKVLLVDDDPVFHFVNGKILKHMGVTIIDTAENGKEALSRIESSENESVPDVIFLDIDMPILNGFGFIEAYNNLDVRYKDKIHIAILSSSTNLDDRRRAKELGIIHFLTKPLTPDSVKPVLEFLISE